MEWEKGAVQQGEREMSKDETTKRKKFRNRSYFYTIIIYLSEEKCFSASTTPKNV